MAVIGGGYPNHSRGLGLLGNCKRIDDILRRSQGGSRLKQKDPIVAPLLIELQEGVLDDV